MGAKRMPKYDPHQLTATQVMRVYALSHQEEGACESEANGPEVYWQGGFKRVGMGGMCWDVHVAL